MVVMRDEAVAKRVEVMRAHGSETKYYHSFVGGNFRFDALQAAVVNVKLPHLDGWTAGRQANAERYRRLFAEKGLVERGSVRLPVEVPERRHIYNQFVIRVERRDELRAYLGEQNIGTEVYYPLCLHMQECFADLGYHKGDFPMAEAAAEETLALPIYPELSDAQAAHVVDCIGRFYG